jgi:chorismate-pyruvate lyase
MNPPTPRRLGATEWLYAYVPAQDLLAARALRGAEIAPAGLWARRSRIQFSGVSLLSHEVFLPSTGRL